MPSDTPFFFHAPTSIMQAQQPGFQAAAHDAAKQQSESCWSGSRGTEITPDQAIWAQLSMQLGTLCSTEAVDHLPSSVAANHQQPQVEPPRAVTSEAELISSPVEVPGSDCFGGRASVGSPEQRTSLSSYSFASSIGTLAASADPRRSEAPKARTLSGASLQDLARPRQLPLSASDSCLTGPRLSQTSRAPALCSQSGLITPAAAPKPESSAAQPAPDHGGIRLLLGIAEGAGDKETRIPLDLANPVHICLLKSLITRAETLSTETPPAKAEAPRGILKVHFGGALTCAVDCFVGRVVRTPAPPPPKAPNLLFCRLFGGT